MRTLISRLWAVVRRWRKSRLRAWLRCYKKACERMWSIFYSMPPSPQARRWVERKQAKLNRLVYKKAYRI